MSDQPSRGLRDLLSEFKRLRGSIDEPGEGEWQAVARWSGQLWKGGLISRLLVSRGTDRVSACDELCHIVAPIARVALLRARRRRVYVGDSLALEEDLMVIPDPLVPYRPQSPGVFSVWTELLDGAGTVFLSTRGGQTPVLQVVNHSPLLAVDAELILDPTRVDQLRPFLAQSPALFYFDLAEQDRTLEVRQVVQQLGGPVAAVLVHPREAAEIRTLGVDFRPVFLAATLRRLEASGVTIAAVITEAPVAALAAARANLMVKSLEEYARESTRPTHPVRGGRPTRPSLTQRLDRMTNTRLVVGNRCHVELDNRRAREDLFKGIDDATATIHIQTYIVRDGVFADQLGARLVQAARRNVKVRLIVDGVLGTANALVRGLTQTPGVEVLSANPIASREDIETLQLKRRDHRKIVVIDDRVAFVSGRNLADEYYTGFDEVAVTDWTPHQRVPWLDAHVEIEGPLVADIQTAFASHWMASGGRAIETDVAPPVGPRPAGPSAARLVLHEGVEDASAMLGYEALIDGANEHVYIVNDFPIVMSLQLAIRRAIARGVTVTILTGNGVTRRGDGTFLEGPLYREAFEYMTKQRLETLVRAGVRAVEFIPPPHSLVVCRGDSIRPYVHAKIVTADGLAASIGSANLDAAASYWEREANVVIEDPNVVSALESHLENACQAGFVVDPTSIGWRRESLLRDLAAQLWPESLYS